MATNQHMKISLLYAVSSALALAAWITVGTKIDIIVGAGLLLAIPEIILLIFTINKQLVYSSTEVV